MKEICKPDAALAKLVLPKKAQSGFVYVPSQYALPFSHNGRQYVFNTFTKQLIEGELPSSAHAGEGFDDWIEAMYLVPEDKDECAFYESTARMLRLFGKKKGVSGYTIMPTLGCNARCVYCYEEGVKQVKMTPEIVEQTVRYILKTRKEEKIGLSWFGGEPLLCVDIIDHICDRLREEDVPFKSTMITNGSLLTPEIIEKMQTRWNLNFVQVSMDGAEQDYIDRKRYYGNADRYHAVMHSIGLLSEAGIRVAVRVNVDEGNWPGIPQFLDDMKRFVENKDNVSVYFSPLMNVRADENDLAMWEKVIPATDLVKEAGFRTYAYMGPGLKFRSNRCMADGGSVVIAPDGSLYPCEHCPPESRFGDVFNGTTDEAAEREFRKPDGTREMCRTCTFLPECTSFANCPWVDAHCKEAHAMNVLAGLKRLIDRKETEANETGEEDPVC